MAKVLNLDSLAGPEVRELVIAGKTYKVKEMDVADFIEVNKIVAKMENEKDPAKQLEETVNLLQRGLPDIERSVLLSLSLEKLGILMSFVRGDDLPTVEGEAAEGSEGK